MFKIPNQNRPNHPCNTTTHLQDPLLSALPPRTQNFRKQRRQCYIQGGKSQSNNHNISHIVDINIYRSQTFTP